MLFFSRGLVCQIFSEAHKFHPSPLCLCVWRLRKGGRGFVICLKTETNRRRTNLYYGSESIPVFSTFRLTESNFIVGQNVWKFLGIMLIRYTTSADIFKVWAAPLEVFKHPGWINSFACLALFNSLLSSNKKGTAMAPGSLHLVLIRSIPSKPPSCWLKGQFIRAGIHQSLWCSKL